MASNDSKFPHKIFLTNTQVSSFREVFANN